MTNDKLREMHLKSMFNIDITFRQQLDNHIEISKEYSFISNDWKFLGFDKPYHDEKIIVINSFTKELSLEYVDSDFSRRAENKGYTHWNSIPEIINI